VISLLCSNYNSEEWIDGYLKYLNSQFLYEFEVIFVDANSTDTSLQTIKNFQLRKGIQKKVIECKDRVGIYEAWNMAIKESRYDYVMNYNTDDKLFPAALSNLAAYLKTYPDIDVFYSNCFITDDKDHNNIINFYNWWDANQMSNLMQGCCCGPFPLLKKQSVVDAGLFDPSFTISGDYEMWCRMNAKGYKFKKIDEPVGAYYHNPAGMSTANNPERHAEHVRQDTLIRDTYRRFV